MDQMKCDDLIRSLSDYIDGDIQPEICAALEEHLKGCKNCQIVVDTMKKTIYLYHDEAEHNGIPGEVKDKLFHKLDLQDFINRMGH